MEREDRTQSRRTRLVRAAVIGAFLAATLLLLGRAAAFVRAIRNASVGRSQADGGPRLVLEQTERDLGAVAQGTPVCATFHLRNAGTRRLVVTERRCGACARAGRQGSLLIGPGEADSIPVELDTTGRQGGLRRVARYTTNDPRRPEFQLTVRAQVSAGQRVSESLQPTATDLRSGSSH